MASYNVMVGLKQVGLDAMLAQVKYLSLHSADPGNTGANELSGGSYARQAASWSAAAPNGATPTQADKPLSAAPSWPVPAGSTVSYIGWWSAATGGTFLGSEDVADEVYNQAGTYSNSSNVVSMA